MDQLQHKVSPIASTDGEESGSGSQRRPAKKRKATYLITKEEKDRLSEEVQELKAQLAVLKEQVGLTGNRTVKKVAMSNAVLGGVLRQQQLLLVNAQAGLAASMRGPAPNPLYSYIHLGVDHEQRRRTLNSIRDFKIQNGVDFIKAYSHHLDLLEPYATSEQFVDSQGNFCFSFFDVVQFDGVKSVRAVYHAALCHFMNEEILISERLGHITVRDDFSVEDDKFENCRLSWIDEYGVKTEANTASFAQYVEREQSLGNTPLGILVRDSVDVDEMFPYSPNECARKDYQGVIMLTTATRKSGGNADEVVVVMRRAVYVKIYRPSFPLSSRSLQGLKRGAMDWCDVMLESMRSILSSRTKLECC